MSPIRFLLPLLALGWTATAAQVEVESFFADIPADTAVPETPETLAKAKGITLLSSPKVVVEENALGKIEVTSPTAVPGGGQVGLGVSLAVKTSITDKGNIWFSGQLTDRSRGGAEKTEQLQTAGFIVREWFFSGYIKSGGTVVIRTTPATSQTVKDGKKVTNTRELVVLLKLNKLTTPPVAKPTTPVRKTGTTKPAAGLRTKTKR